MTFNSYQRAVGTAQNFKYSGKEEQEEWGVYDFEARMYDAALGRFNSVDIFADQRNWLTPYNYVQNNPLIRIDPTGMLDIYSLDKETGDIDLVVKTNDNHDDLIDSESLEVISSEVDKGLLSDGQNIMNNGLETSNVKGGIGLVKDISMHTKDEIGGTVYGDSDGNNFLSVNSYERSTFTSNENGEVTTVTAGFTLPGKKGSFTSSNGSFTGTTKYSFHTHPGHPKGIGNIGTAIPSQADIVGALDSGIPQFILGARSASYKGTTGDYSQTTRPSVRGTNGAILPGGVTKTIMKRSKR